MANPRLDHVSLTVIFEEIDSKETRGSPTRFRRDPFMSRPTSEQPDRFRISSYLEVGLLLEGR